ncbi:MAG: hypothetical protein JXL85_01930 [Bacilli bacterium]|nr:hypothetical protein [Bacilli bacterium]
MATYKRGYKKQNSETVLLKVIIGIIVAVFAFVALAFVYDAVTKWRSYDYYTTITEYEGIFEYTNGGDEALEDYVVYFYSDTCSNCKDIKNSVLKDGNRLNRDGEMFFLANTGTMTDEDAQLAGFLDEIGEQELGTPMLVVVANGEFYGVYMGSTLVSETMDSISSGTFDAFNE